MPYIEKTLALGLTLERGKTHHVNIAHDDWCKIYDGGCCSCDADVRVLPGPAPLKWSEDFRRRCRERRKKPVNVKKGV